MKKLLVFLFVALSVASYAIIFQGPDGLPRDVSAANPLPITGISMSAGQSAYTTVTSTNTTSTAVSAQVASLAARLVVRITNQSATETVWIAENSTVATVSFGLPLLPYQVYEEILGPGVPVAYISATTCKINIFQAK